MKSKILIPETAPPKASGTIKTTISYTPGYGEKLVSEQQTEQPSKTQPNPDPSTHPDYRVVPAANGLLWIKRAFTLFKRNPGVWMSCSMVMFIIIIVLMLIPFLFPFSFIVTPVFIGGIMIGCQKLKLGDGFTINQLFSGFDKNIAKLSSIGITYFLGTIVSSILALSLSELAGNQVYQADMNELMTNQAEMLKFAESMVLPMLIMMGLMIPVLMAFWFAPALVTLREESSFKAMKKSLHACAINTLPFLIYGIVALFGILFISIILGVVAAVMPPLGMILKFIANLILTSVILASIYTSFDDIFPQLSDSTDEPEDHSGNSLIA